MKNKKFVLFGTVLVVAASLIGSAFVKADFEFSPLSLQDLREKKISNELLEEEVGKGEPIEVEVPVCGKPILDAEGNSYATIQMGDDCWMAENLRTKLKNDGTCINGGSAPCADASVADNGKGRACYDNNEANCASEGALYTFLGIGGNINTPGNQGICPDGWHIPVNDELTDLERSACTSATCATDFPYGGLVAGPRGTNEGTSLKVGGCSRFNAVLTGRRDANGINFSNRGNSTWLWSSEYAIPSVYRRMLTANSGQITRDGGNLSFDRSQSLRCVRNIPVPSFCGETITDRDGYTYKTIRIGDQCWMAENLKTKTKADGTCINGGSAPCADASVSDNGKGRSCYGNLEANCNASGALYTFSGIGGNIAMPGSQGICPNGWHIPVNNEFTTLERAVCISGTCETDFPYGGLVAGGRGTNEGTSLKEGGCSRFNAVLTGRREGNGVTFTNLANSTWFWSSEYAIPSVYRRLLTAGSGQVFRDAGNLSFNRSQSLRCVKNL